MKKTSLIMGMPITAEIVGSSNARDIDRVFDYFRSVDERFSTYKITSEVSKINEGLPEAKWSQEMKLVLGLCEETKGLTNGYFDAYHKGSLDPSGLVKGWAIQNAARLFLDRGIKNFYIEAGGDIQVHGTNSYDEPWEVGIRNPFNIEEIIKSVRLTNQGIATSGTYIRGQHIYNPHQKDQVITQLKSLTVISSNVYEADRYATAAFAMGEEGIAFIEVTSGLEGYAVNSKKTATYTSGFERYLTNHV